MCPATDHSGVIGALAWHPVYSYVLEQKQLCSGLESMIIKKGVLQVEGMRHPLLLQGALAPLPQPPSAASEDVGTSYLDSYAPGADVPRQSPSNQPPHPETHQVHMSRDLHQPCAQCAVVFKSK